MAAKDHKPRGMSWVEWARKHGVSPADAGRLGIIPQHVADQYQPRRRSEKGRRKGEG